MRNMRWAAVLALLAAGGCRVAEEEWGAVLDIAGVVQTPAGEPIPGVRVALIAYGRGHWAGETMGQTYTNGAGRFGLRFDDRRCYRGAHSGVTLQVETSEEIRRPDCTSDRQEFIFIVAAADGAAAQGDDAAAGGAWQRGHQ
jgi:hypothetical protein